jgi:hypothetical protein
MQPVDRNPPEIRGNAPGRPRNPWRFENRGSTINDQRSTDQRINRSTDGKRHLATNRKAANLEVHATVPFVGFCGQTPDWNAASGVSVLQFHADQRINGSTDQPSGGKRLGPAAFARANLIQEPSGPGP